MSITLHLKYEVIGVIYILKSGRQIIYNRLGLLNKAQYSTNLEIRGVVYWQTLTCVDVDMQK